MKGNNEYLKMNKKILVKADVLNQEIAIFYVR